MSGTNFRGGRKPFPKPSAFESEIHPPHKPSVYAPGYFALAGGRFAQARIKAVRLPYCQYPCAPKDGTHGRRCFQWLHFWENVRLRLRDFAEVPLRLSESASRESPGYGHRFTVSRPMAAAHKEIDEIGLSAKGKEKRICEKKLVYRNGETA